jgi:hypothetical protein
VVPWDGVDRRRDEDAKEKRRRSRRRFRLGGRRAVDGSQKRERRGSSIAPLGHRPRVKEALHLRGLLDEYDAAMAL